MDRFGEDPRDLKIKEKSGKLIPDRRDENRDSRLSAVEMVEEIKKTDPKLAGIIANEKHFAEASTSGYIEYVYNVFIAQQESKKHLHELIYDANSNSRKLKELIKYYNNQFEIERTKAFDNGANEMLQRVKSTIDDLKSNWRLTEKQLIKKQNMWKFGCLVSGSSLIIIIIILIFLKCFGYFS